MFTINHTNPEHWICSNIFPCQKQTKQNKTIKQTKQHIFKKKKKKSFWKVKAIRDSADVQKNITSESTSDITQPKPITTSQAEGFVFTAICFDLQFRILK